ncbi:MAG: RNA polymerase sigma-70 factor (ECF subfamily) [Rhodothermales bacterium]|jgi:RNA polymerase sigma-70 factor (ECF subfamily)
MDDRDLIIQARAGDLDAFCELVKRYQDNVRTCLVVRLDTRHEVEDLAQEAFVVAFRKLDEFDEEKAFGPWIRSIAFNLLRNYWRKHRAEPVGGAEELAMLIDEEIGLRYSQPAESDMHAALKLCIEKLTEPMRKLLGQRYHDGLSVGQLATRLDLQHSTMTMRLHRLREQLRLCIQAEVNA